MTAQITAAPTAGARRSGAGPAGRPRELLERVLRDLRYAGPALLGYAVVRAVGLLMMVLSPHPQAVLGRLGSLWDARWYADIATRGYTDDLGWSGANGTPYSTRAFFPLYPMLIGAVHAVLPVTVGSASLLVAWTASLVAAAGIFAVVAERYGRRVGTLTAVLWGVLPHAAVQSMAYSESLFTALAAWTLFALLRRHWLRAGTLSLLAGLVRPTAAAVAAAVGAAALVELVGRFRGRRAPAPVDRPGWWRVVLGALLSPLGFLGYIGYVDHARGTLSGYSDVQSAWGTQFDAGAGTWHWLEAMFLRGGGSRTTLNQVVIAAVVVAFVTLFLITVVQRQPLPWLVHSATMLAVALGSSATDAARARFLLPAFVLLVPPAAGLARLRSTASRWLVIGSAALCSGAYGVFLVFGNIYSP
ncbi:hypothetical protein OG455_24080 [Kitasatospora sp. NBC_01287]|uniref:hypothetical protein n=1 Tax=Kitasatospora sp. NBC_01287 TaxID=2903573 RepID=UPI002251E311|nr:hypothetical protein [Kitasatospora sp. NBC_01287]MCX4748557.1 hypothetical protein [Kitasatospora sp. NBC_01287]